MENKKELLTRLKQYEEEHRDLDQIINQLHQNKTVKCSQLELRYKTL